MALIQYAAPWNSQPQEAVQLRADLAQELGFYGGFINPQTAWHKGQAYAPSGLQPSPSVDGLAIVNTTGTAVASYPFNGSPESAELTLVIRFCRFGAQPDSGFGTALHAPKVGGLQDPFIWFIKDAGERVRINTSTNDASGQSWETTTSWPVGESQIGVVTWVAGSQPIIYRNGKSQTLSVSGTTPGGTLKQSTGFLNVNLAGLRMNGALSAGLVFNKAWSAQQVAAYTSDLPGLLQLVEPRTIWVPVSAGGGGPIATGRADETDTALGLSAVQIKAVGQASETDSALALSAVQSRAVGRADEIGAAFALVPVQLAPIGLATETDTALALSAGVANGVGLASETDTAFALAAVQIKATGLAAEVDTALALTGVTGTAPGIATESDTAFALVAVQKMLVGIASEVDTALALSPASAPGADLALILKILRNRQELNPSTGKFTLYDDDGTTILAQSNAWADVAGTRPYSGGTLARIDALI